MSSPVVARATTRRDAAGTAMDLSTYLRDVPDFPKPGILFKDITPLLAAPAAMKAAIAQLAAMDFGALDRVAAIESRGFLFGAPLALQLGKPFVPIRKPGKLPWKTNRIDYVLEYGTDAVEIHKDGVHRGERVLLVDDLLATGGTMGAACRLIEACGGTVAGCAFVVELAFLKGRDRLQGTRVASLIRLP
jgi:adenine phosphoribosyltransferase